MGRGVVRVVPEELTLSNPIASLGILATMARSVIVAGAVRDTNLARQLRNHQQNQLLEIEGSRRCARFFDPHLVGVAP